MWVAVVRKVVGWLYGCEELPGCKNASEIRHDKERRGRERNDETIAKIERSAG